ncbi:MAG: hypothetical protein ACJ74O_11285 [Frankiaceae bacterium]
MRWWELALDYLRVLVWPAAVVTVLVVYRKPIGWLITHIKRLSWGSASAELTDEARELADVARTLPVPEPRHHDVTIEDDAGLSDTEPRAAKPEPDESSLAHSPLYPAEVVLSSWRDFENVCERVARRLGIDLSRRPSGNPTARYVVGELLDRGLASKEDLQLTTALAVLRNQIGHEPAEASASLAMDFAFTASRLSYRIEAMALDND